MNKETNRPNQDYYTQNKISQMMGYHINLKVNHVMKF